MNPFDELQLDPRLSPEELTDVLRRRAERASGEDKKRIQELWRKLTLREDDRVRWAFLAHPRPPAADPTSVEALRDRVPPTLGRPEPPELKPTLADAMVLPAREATDATTLKPDALYDDD